MCKIVASNVLPAFEDHAVGSRVLDRASFLAVLERAVSGHDFSTDRVVGQGKIVLGPEVHPFVSAGVGKRSANPSDYIIAVHRGEVGLYLKREFAASVERVACIVYTREAYLRDPDVLADLVEYRRIDESGADYVLVAVLADAGPDSLTPLRFLHNLSGGNREALLWDGDEIRAKAKDVLAYHRQWCIVAD